MKFKYVCIDCGKEFVTDEVIYQCPECAKKSKDGEFPRGYLKVIYDNDELKKLKKKNMFQSLTSFLMRFQTKTFIL